MTAAGNDFLCESPLFRVFCFGDGWRVCCTNLEGEPVSDHSKHSTLSGALNEASRANEIYAGIEPIFPMKRGA